MRLKTLGFSIALLSSFLFVGCTTDKELSIVQKQEQVSLGQALFFDKNLSKFGNQACATCHNPESGFADNRENIVGSMASMGSDGKSMGDRNAPSAAYAKFSPSFHYNEEKKKFIGGQFWDGREATLAGQAGGPPLNPIEMGMSSKNDVIERLKDNAYYKEAFERLYGENIFKNVDLAFSKMTEAIESFEMSDEFAPFDSKYDRYLKGEYDLTPLEDLGKSLFFSNNNTNCSTCHMLRGEDKQLETFTNYEYHNIGVPVNTHLRSKNGVADEFIDEGLYANPNVTDINEKGKFKVPTLRNVAVTGPYMHNGVFKDLKTVIEFYDKYNNSERKINPETGKPWAEPEYAPTISKEELKSKALTDRKVEALVAFLKLLTDKKYEHLLEK